ncbi:hypothetical protein CYLTODRAFT_419995 [Cylindrobasidium torrendii FP15055 ss-10]|uniref:Uncharacterized protein n=1 Tax=Cylindrobasidium torrendii FP15055 ss-10 TaxID=1314674 RepID=A0A0D7BKK4_9AGAR|nr:hypothetical protein CYLTODRAFT_419995 [Cylindrobasidium torrendii FP15055 ss-10]
MPIQQAWRSEKTRTGNWGDTVNDHQAIIQLVTSTLHATGTPTIVSESPIAAVQTLASAFKKVADRIPILETQFERQRVSAAKADALRSSHDIDLRHAQQENATLKWMNDDVCQRLTDAEKCIEVKDRDIRELEIALNTTQAALDDALTALAMSGNDDDDDDGGDGNDDEGDNNDNGDDNSGRGAEDNNNDNAPGPGDSNGGDEASVEDDNRSEGSDHEEGEEDDKDDADLKDDADQKDDESEEEMGSESEEEDDDDEMEDDEDEMEDDEDEDEDDSDVDGDELEEDELEEGEFEEEDELEEGELQEDNDTDMEPTANEVSPQQGNPVSGAFASFNPFAGRVNPFTQPPPNVLQQQMDVQQQDDGMEVDGSDYQILYQPSPMTSPSNPLASSLYQPSAFAAHPFGNSTASQQSHCQQPSAFANAQPQPMQQQQDLTGLPPAFFPAQQQPAPSQNLSGLPAGFLPVQQKQHQYQQQPTPPQDLVGLPAGFLPVQQPQHQPQYPTKPQQNLAGLPAAFLPVQQQPVKQQQQQLVGLSAGFLPAQPQSPPPPLPPQDLSTIHTREDLEAAIDLLLVMS